MKLNRQALIEAVDRAIEREDKAIQAAQDQVAREHQERVDEWLDANRQPWLDAIKVIQKRLRNGEPVQEKDIPYCRTRRSNGAAIWRSRGHTAIPDRDVTLPGLRNVLAAVADETVTTTALRDLGVTPRTLNSIIPLLGAHTATANRKAAV